MTLCYSQIFRNSRSRRAFLSLISVFSNFLTNFKILSPYLFLRTSAIESFNGKQSLVRNINTNDTIDSMIIIVALTTSQSCVVKITHLSYP